MKPSIPRLFDAARLLATQAGQQMAELIQFCQFAFEQLIRALQNNLSFEDNFRCQVLTLTLRHQVTTKVALNGTATGIIVTRVFPTTKSFEQMSNLPEMHFDSSGSMLLTASFVSADPTRDINVTVVVLLA